MVGACSSSYWSWFHRLGPRKDLNFFKTDSKLQLTLNFFVLRYCIEVLIEFMDIDDAPASFNKCHSDFLLVEDATKNCTQSLSRYFVFRISKMNFMADINLEIIYESLFDACHFSYHTALHGICDRTLDRKKWIDFSDKSFLELSDFVTGCRKRLVEK